MAEGHPEAAKYRVAVVWSEVRIVRERLSRRARDEAILMQTVITSVLSKDGSKVLNKLLKDMEDVG